MHYKNGREAKENDFVITKLYDKVVAGKLSQLQSGGCPTCNAVITYPVLGGYSCLTVTVGECYHAEDAWTAIDFLWTIGKPTPPPATATPEATCTAAPSTVSCSGTNPA